jgi:hypothetical protein
MPGYLGATDNYDSYASILYDHDLFNIRNNASETRDLFQGVSPISAKQRGALPA